MTILKGELQTDNGDLLYPHTSSTVVFGPDGTPVSKQIDVLSNDRGYLKSKDLPNGVDLSSIIANGKYKGYDAGNVPTGITGENYKLDVNDGVQVITFISNYSGKGNSTWLRETITHPWRRIATGDEIGNLSEKVNMQPPCNNKTILSHINDLVYKGIHSGCFTALSCPELPVQSWGYGVSYRLIESGQYYVEIKMASNRAPILYNHLLLNPLSWAFSDWQQIATTSKIKILCTPVAGNTILDQNSYQINNIVYYNITVKKSDGTNYPSNSFIDVANIPSGKQPSNYVASGSAYAYGSSSISVGSCAFTNTNIITVVLNNSSNNTIRMSGTVVL